jgi:DNA-directed RNA polymerase specialized sigma24 family protein
LAYEVTLHELNGLAGKAGNVALKRLNIRLDERRRDDLHDYLVEIGVRMARDYDPSVGQAFSTWFYRCARRGVIDWLRKTHGDPRHKRGPLAKLEVHYPSASLDAIVAVSTHEDARFRSVEDPEPDSLADAIVELGQNLSPDARWALVNIAGRMAEGANVTTALNESLNGVDIKEAGRRLELLRKELEASEIV